MGLQMRQTKRPHELARQEKVEDKLIDRVYRERCSGMQISVMRIPELFRLARLMLREDPSLRGSCTTVGGTHYTTEQMLGDFMVKFVEREKL